MNATSPAAHKRVYLADYAPPDFLVDLVELHFELDAAVTRVRSRLSLRRNPASANRTAPLSLAGRRLSLRSLHVDGQFLAPDQYTVTDDGLTIPCLRDRSHIEVETELQPAENKSGLGMFVAGGVIATQCEPEGFRRITYFPDRPDVLARYTVTLTANSARYPVLLSNGNRTAQHALDGGRHSVTWHDPFPKPSYLFAIVAGDLVSLGDTHVTSSGRQVALGIFASQDQIGLCGHAMQALKNAMRWDEEVYGLECDLDVYNVVALNGYVGAMENKGLNIFDVQLIVADSDVATDEDYQLIERIVAHEYFHNWSGNRVTCRDWFQLSLKEGLTRFRDQQFSVAMSGSTEPRIGFVQRMMTDQFAEDAGPAKHAVQPPSFIEISNFYTATVYDKGAELVRMLHELLGPAGYRRGTALYFERHDGTAVTTEHFVRCMEEASGRDLSQFRLWYTQVGTPRLRVRERFDADDSSYTLTIEQSVDPLPGQAAPAPLHIPIAIGLLDAAGCELVPSLEGEPPGREAGSRVLELRRAVESFRFTGLKGRPTASLGRGFTAPVRIEMERDDAGWTFLVRHDTDAVARWDASQRVLSGAIRALSDDVRAGRPLVLPEGLAEAFAAVIKDPRDRGLAARLLQLPDEFSVGERMPQVDIDAIAAARAFAEQALGTELRDGWLSAYHSLACRDAYSPDARSIATRRLRNLCLGYLAAIGDRDGIELCRSQVEHADNITDALAALTTLSHIDCPQRIVALDDFYERWRHNDLVVNKWLFVQGCSRVPGTAVRVRELMGHPAFDITNRAKVMALVGGFCRRNYVQFHDPSGAGYRLLRDALLVGDAMHIENGYWLMPQIMQWRRFDPVRQGLMRAELEYIVARPGISAGLYETVSNALRDTAAA